MTRPSPHTSLINTAIAFCKKGESYIHPLADLGYEAKLIEQKIGTASGGKKVHPDVVAVSERLVHSLVIECKGGRTLDTEQISRYKMLKSSDLRRWHHIHDPNKHTHDICLLIYREHDNAFICNTDVPILSLSETNLKKHNNFSNSQLNRKFDKEISIQNKAPISYYPFSPNDDRKVIIPHALRTILLATISGEGWSGTIPPVTDAVMRQVHKMWDILSREHQRLLQESVQTIIRELVQLYPTLKEFLEKTTPIERQDNSRVNRLHAICKQIISDKDRTTLDDYVDSSHRMQ